MTGSNTRELTIHGQQVQVECKGIGENVEIHVRPPKSEDRSGIAQMTTAIKSWVDQMNTRGGGQQQHHASFRETGGGGDYAITVTNVPQGEYGQYMDQLETFFSTRATGASAATGGTNQRAP